MNLKSKLSLFLVLAIGLFSCTVVKSPQSADFHRVKYNSHIKFAKKANKEKLPETVTSFDADKSSEARATESVIEPMSRSVNYKSLTASANAVAAVPKTAKEEELKTKVEAVETKSKSKTEPIFNPYTEVKERSNISSYLNSPAPVASDEALGDILYIILVVLLILIILSIISDLAGGLIGALIAVLLILLILRLLGYV